VILMQENRSFDHYYGSLRGVRGFSDKQVLKYQDGYRRPPRRSTSPGLTSRSRRCRTPPR
jgi:phospholipase C